MLEPPDIPNEQIIDQLRAAYGLRADSLDFLPIGYDVNTAVYRASAHPAAHQAAHPAADGAVYFLKLRRGAFNPITVTLPLWLKSQGSRAVIAPVTTTSGQGWAGMDPYTLVLYPYIEGDNGYAQELTEAQWRDFGAAMRGIHQAPLPQEIAGQLPRETFSPTYRDLVREFQARVEATTYDDPVAAKLAAFLRGRRAVIDRLLARADGFAARARQGRTGAFTLCHNDIHPGNLLIARHPAPDHSGLYIVDWDAPILAPKERDLALVGGCFTWKDPRATALFYQGYAGDGSERVNREALAYYRCERILTDIAEFCKQLLLTNAGGADREQAYQYCTGSFQPGSDVDIALQT